MLRRILPKAKFWKVELHLHRKGLGQVDIGTGLGEGRIRRGWVRHQALLDIYEASLGSVTEIPSEEIKEHF